MTVALHRRNPALHWLWARISRRTARVAVAGTGGLGLPLACRLAVEAGFCVTVVEPDRERFAQLKRGRSLLPGLPDHRASRLNNIRRHKLAMGPAAVSDCDVVVLHLSAGGSARETAEAVLPFVKRGSLLFFNLAPGADPFGPALQGLLQSFGRVPGRDLFLAWTAGGIRPLNGSPEPLRSPRSCAGWTPDCRRAGEFFLGASFRDMVPIWSAT